MEVNLQNIIAYIMKNSKEVEKLVRRAMSIVHTYTYACRGKDYLYDACPRHVLERPSLYVTEDGGGVLDLPHIRLTMNQS